MGHAAGCDGEIQQHEEIAEPEAGADICCIDDRAAQCVEIVRLGSKCRQARLRLGRRMPGRRVRRRRIGACGRLGTSCRHHRIRHR
ncbi:hypothetical protein DAA51_28735 [Bradyrhizobium sp. WBAH10]|nr:hypothetical protein DAA51_28735 [Bradyrhizobium sp. WBAH10]QCJ92074.1 hypothetical protein DAA57_28985 [Bradyrhizobium yuanmingense]